MGSKELIESLRRAADERIRLIWKDAEGEASKAKAEVSRRLDRIRESSARTESLAATAAQVAAVSVANNLSRKHMLKAERALSDRLFSVALSSLPRLRNSGYGVAFEKMAQELPPLAWKSVRVNPEDVDLAKSMFASAEVIPDKRISGGVDATTEGGKIRVINTLEKRLERAWMDMLPGLIKDAYDAIEKRT